MSQMKAIVDKLLTDVSVGYFPEGYIADQILPFKKVMQESGLIGTYGKDHLRIERSFTGGRGKYRTVESTAKSSSSYLVESHGLADLVTEADYRNVEQPFDAEADAVLGLTSKIMLEKEKVIADALGSISVLTQNVTLVGADQLNDFTNSDPLGVFLTARKAVYDGCGLPPNKAIISWDVMNTLAYHPAILQALGFAQNRAGQLSAEELAKAMGVEKLLIGKVKYNSGAEGATDVLSSVWGKNIVMYYAPDTIGKRQMSLGAQVGFSDQRRVFKNAVNNPPNSVEVLVDDHYDWVIVDGKAGYLIKDAIA